MQRGFSDNRCKRGVLAQGQRRHIRGEHGRNDVASRDHGLRPRRRHRRAPAAHRRDMGPDAGRYAVLRDEQRRRCAVRACDQRALSAPGWRVPERRSPSRYGPISTGIMLCSGALKLPTPPGLASEPDSVFSALAEQRLVQIILTLASASSSRRAAPHTLRLNMLSSLGAMFFTPDRVHFG